MKTIRLKEDGALEITDPPATVTVTREMLAMHGYVRAARQPPAWFEFPGVGETTYVRLERVRAVALAPEDGMVSVVIALGAEEPLQVVATQETADAFLRALGIL